MINKFYEALNAFDGTTLPIAFADVEFEFLADTSYPNLCVKHYEYVQKTLTFEHRFQKHLNSVYTFI